MKKYIRVAVSGPLRRSFTYFCDKDILSKLSPGATLTVPFGRKVVAGFYLEETTRPNFPTKEIRSTLICAPSFDQERFKFYKWIADYYFANPADVLSLAIEPRLRKRGAKVFLGENVSEGDFFAVPERIQKRLSEGKSLRPNDIREIDNLQKGGVLELLRKGALVEKFTFSETNFRQITGYQILDSARLRDSLDRAEAKLTLSDSAVSRERLIKSGLSVSAIRTLVRNASLEPVYADPLSNLLERFRVRAGLRELALNSQQDAVVKRICESFEKGYETFLLHGITGSGKTLVYCHLAEKALSRGKSVLILTPEIVLAGETLGYIRGYFKEEVALWHSGLTQTQRAALWQKVYSGAIRIVVGARSALFAPIQNLGLIIVDEEHDESYKQDDPAPRFNARDSSVMLGRISKIPVVLGSGTPSIESYFNALSGRYTLLKLTERPGGASAPEIRLIDLNKDKPVDNESFLSETLRNEAQKRLDKGEQVILYLNRRGFSPRLRCRECGDTPACPDCSATLTYHLKGNRLICHFCGYAIARPDKCEACKKGGDFIFLGHGSQRIEDSVTSVFEGARPLRLDSDSSASKRVVWRSLNDFANEKYNLLIGTQMISKGIDFPKVTLVGAIIADFGLGVTDFRANEKTFAKLTQVAGRCGRAERKGLALAQTFDPNSRVMSAVAKGDYESFFEGELFERRQKKRPPYRLKFLPSW
ncbi:MAG: primosomal protein N' [candidate division Zixibacteria bacterium]|nr:primosomal protein N' [candidate division Zixibacteria bacterium]